MKGLYMPQVYYYKHSQLYVTHLFIEIDIG